MKNYVIDVLDNFDLDKSCHSVYECIDFISKLSADRLKFGLTCLLFNIDFCDKDRKLTYKEYTDLDTLITYIKWGENDDFEEHKIHDLSIKK